MVQSSWWWLPWVAMASAVGLVPALFAWRRGRRASALRWLGWATLPWAAWLLGVVSLVARVADAFADWSARFVFNPAAWTGMALALVAMASILVGTRLEGARGRGDGDTTAPARPRSGRQLPGKTDPAEDDIEAILRKHGIS